jgi:hypothetical protein
MKLPLILAAIVALLAPAGLGENVHIVRNGETYADIARELGVDQDALRKANDDLELRPGRLLRIPAKPEVVQAETPPRTVEEVAAPPRVKEGGFYQLWYDAPRNRFAGLKERRTFVRVREIKGDWVYADLIYNEGAAYLMLVLSELDKGNPELEKQLLTNAGINKEELLKKASEKPRGEFEMRSLWINLVHVEAIEAMDLEAALKKAKEAGE